MGFTMSAWLGPLGNMIEFAHYKGSASADLDRKVTFTDTIGGGRFGQASPATGLRTWSLSATHMDPSQWAGFDLLTMGAYGDQHRFLEPLSLVTNVISPLKSLPGLAGSTAGVTGNIIAGGLMATDDGLRLPSIVVSRGSAFIQCNAPVIPGVPITASVYAQGSSVALIIRFFDADGKLLQSPWMPVVNTTPGPMKRISGTRIPPAGAAYADIAVSAATAFSAPAITWTSQLMPWSRGRGCEKAVIHGISDSTVLAGRFDHQQIADFDFTVTEVGDGA